jgi:isoleucyl-tRNA synthetase
MDTLGADILRLWVASTDYSGELTISDEILKRVTEGYRRIRNTLRFLLANLADFDPAQHQLPVEEWLEIDRYALALAAGVQEEIAADYGRYEFHLVAQKLTSFCSEDLGGFYLDILKDRLYTAGTDSHARRSAQNALHHLTHSLLRLLAPILSFTAEEAWAAMTGKADTLKGTSDSVFLHTWHSFPPVSGATELLEKWQAIRELRARVTKELETVRVSGAIGSSLQAEVAIELPQPLYATVAALEDDLRFVLITSQAKILEGAEEKITVNASTQQKCERCWHYRAEVGTHAEHPTLCGRCVSNLFGAGEARSHA